ncbi:MAG: fumarylacetoacetate hydrolase family protein [Verrucomicrobia subdivision 3 bacterium]|nr:fumarylacetoacetate hydrolase family protein [Limisphaerales bacterium]
MKLYTFEVEGRRWIGAGSDGQLINLVAAYMVMTGIHATKPAAPHRLPTDMLEFLRLGEPALEAARDVIKFIARRPVVPVGERLTYAHEEVKILAPLPRPGKILCSGINYRGHKAENPDAKMPSEPFFFSKLPSSVIGPGEPIIKPSQTEQLDYEVEFAVVIGRAMKRAPESAVMDCIAGYTILHDVSARDVQFKDSQITLGKNFDTFCPLGPCIVTKDELPQPAKVRLRSFVNGKLMQDGNTADWVFSLPKLLSFLSGIMTLEAGDIVSTGTPAGVGVFRKPPVFLKPGDVVRLEAEGIGVLENPVK